MNKKQSIFQKLENPIVFLTFLMIIITICFVIFTPRVSSLIFSEKRELNMNSFITRAQNDRKIDPQEFWKFREFYSPGYFELKDQGLEDSEIQSAQSEIGLLPNNVIYTSLFRSKHSLSLDGVTEAKSLDELIDINPIGEIKFQNNNSAIIKRDEEWIIVFLMPVSEMKKANGFFEYEGKDKELLKNKYWLNLTKIK